MRLKSALALMVAFACLATSSVRSAPCDDEPQARGENAKSSTPAPSRRPEFQADAPVGVADEPGIADMEPDSSHGVSLVATVDRTKFRQLQRVKVKVRMENASDTTFWEPPAGANGYLSSRVRVFDSKGRLVPMTEYYKNEGRWSEVVGMSSGSTGLYFGPGRISHFDLIPNLIFDMTRPGVYWILVEYPLGLATDKENRFYVRSAPIRVEILREVYGYLPDGSFIADPDRP